MAKTPTTTTAPTGNIPPFGLRLLPELKERVEAAAKAAGRSMNAEITSRLEESFSESASAALAVSVAQLQARAIEDQFVLRKYQAALLTAYELLRLARNQARKEGVEVFDESKEALYTTVATTAALISRDIPFSVPVMKKEMERALDGLERAVENYMVMEGDQAAVARHEQWMAEMAAQRELRRKLPE